MASGSAGNAILIETDQVKILIDVGISGRRLERKLEAYGIKTSELTGVIVTHEHIDHVRGLKALAKRGVPVFINPGTFAALTDRSGSHLLQDCESDTSFHAIEPGQTFDVGPITFNPFSVSHDAVNPIGVSLTDGSAKIAIATDLGTVSGLVLERFKDADLVVLEANHDEEMLKGGRYPWPLKQRIMGTSGHLSNSEAAAAVARISHQGLQEVILAHLSADNNRPHLAIGATKAALSSVGHSHIRVSAAEQDAEANMRTIE
jgi:phosphoribosyl 1,2-cyclic phosphodiesterase